MKLVAITASLLVTFFATTLPLTANPPRKITIDHQLLQQNHVLDMVVKRGQVRFDNALAMNVQFEPIKKTHRQISDELGLDLAIFRAWNPDGEAHITVITPVEFYDILKQKNDGSALVSMDEIEKIAKQYSIQDSDIAVLGIGRGKATVEGKNEETYFVIVESMNLRKIRQAIYDLYLSKGGDKGKWNPQHYYPHITVGFTRNDLHEADGVLKSMEHSFDSRFDVIFE